MRMSKGLAVALALFALWSGVPHPARAYTVRTEHPRIWLTPATLQRLRDKAASGWSRWITLKKGCDSYMSSSDPYDVSIMNYALAYQISRDPLYGDKAISLMQRYASKGLDAITSDSGYPTRSVLPAMALGYDWCYDRMTPQQRQSFQAQMEQWADWVWPETNPSRATAWSVNNPGDNYYHGFMMTWMVGLALYGDSPKAPGYIDLALKKWNEKVRPYLESYGAGGYLLEGTNYGAGSTTNIFWYLAAQSTATGDDLLSSKNLPWSAQATLCKIYLTTPDMKRLYPGGDQSRISTAPLSDLDRSAPLVALSFVDSTTAGYTRWWLDHITPNINQWRWTPWEECLWYRDDVPAIDYTQSLPLGYISPGAGWMTSRTSWRTDATQVVMMTGPWREAHEDRAQNGFMIFRGDWMAAIARLNSASGLWGGSPNNNAITIADNGQTMDKEDKTRVLSFVDTTRYAYFAGDGTEAYNSPQLKLLDEWRRELLFLKPNFVIVFDRVRAPNANQVKKFHLNTLNEPKVAGSSYQAVAKSAILFGQSVLPLNATLVKTPMNLGSSGALSSWRVDIAAPLGNNADCFLNVLEIANAGGSPGGATAPSGSTPSPTPVTSLSASRVSLNAVKVGSQVVVFDLAPSATSPIDYKLSAAGSIEHFIFDQAPGKWYRVTIQPSTGGAAVRKLVQATNQGIVSFTSDLTGALSLNVIQVSAATTQSGGRRP